MFTLADPTYIIRSPKNKEEWDVVKQLLLDYKHEFNDDTCFTSFEEEIADIENVYNVPGSQLFIAIEESDKKIVGCVAMRTISPGVAEMKRLYVINLLIHAVMIKNDHYQHIGHFKILFFICYLILTFRNFF